MTNEVRLVRHPEVALRWRGCCYGSRDVGLSRAGRRRAAELVAELAGWRPEIVLWSGVRRTGLVAEALAAATGARLILDPRWRERDFGAWEGRGWNAIYRETGSAMDGMISDPDGFRPGGGETTAELYYRVAAAWAARPAASRAVIVTHGGPIAVVRAIRDDAPLCRLPDYVPPTGSIVSIN